jgi:uncharacterized protein
LSPAISDSGGLLLHVRVTPKGGRNAVIGVRTGSDGKPHLAVRVSAPPRDGEANDAVRWLIAKTTGVSRGAVSIISGERGREKTLKIDGDPEMLKAWLDAIRDGTDA